MWNIIGMGAAHPLSKGEHPEASQTQQNNNKKKKNTKKQENTGQIQTPPTYHDQWGLSHDLYIVFRRVLLILSLK